MINTGSTFRAVFQAAASLAATVGVFDRVNRHEPKNSPGRGINCAVWVDGFEPVNSSGLDSTSARLSVVYRVYMPMLAEPEDEIDPQMLDAIDVLCAAIIAGYTLGGLVRAVDVRGANAQKLSGSAGYVAYGDKVYRAFTITMPCIVNDLWTETP